MEIEELGKLIKHRRKVLGLTTRDLADLAGMSKTTISQIERGVRNPTFEVLKSPTGLLRLAISIWKLKWKLKSVNNKI